VDTNETQGSNQFQSGEASGVPLPPTTGGIPGGATAAVRRVLKRRFVPQVLTLVILGALIGSAYVIAAPPSGDGHTSSNLGAAPAGPVMVTAQYGQEQSLSNGTGITRDSAGQAVPAATAAAMPAGDTKGVTADGVSLAALDATQIVKTGSMALEVGDIDRALTQATATIKGFGGYVSDSSRSSNGYIKDSSGASGTNVIATLTFRIPANKWDEALGALHEVGSRLISENTNTTDVTTQVIDIDARIANLQKTEAALQSVMTQATKVDDILAVQRELTTTRGEIEQLTAESTHLKGQASMSTLSVSFTLPAKPNTTQATEGWSWSDQIDQAGAALVRIGQGLGTIAVWAVVVVLPIGLVILALLLIAAIVRRITRRGRKDTAAAA